RFLTFVVSIPSLSRRQCHERITATKEDRIMRCIGIGLLTLLFVSAAWGLDDKKDENPPTPAAELNKLRQDFQKAQQDALKAVREAKTDEERTKAQEEVRNLSGKYAEEFITFA